MKRFIIMLTLAVLMTALMGMNVLPARADITNGSCDYSVDDECGGGGGYSVTTAQQCYSACMSDNEANTSSYGSDILESENML